MTESEILTRNPPPTITHPPQHQLHQQHQQQQHIQRPTTSSLLLQSNVRLEHPSGRPEMLAISNQINELEGNYHMISEKFGKASQSDAIETLTSFAIEPELCKQYIHGFFFGVLVDPQNAEKHFNCLKATVTIPQQWNSVLTSFNMLLLELYPLMKQQCKQQLFFFIDEVLKLPVRASLDMSIANVCRALSDGSEFRETCLIVHQFAQRLLANRKWFLAFPRNCTFPPTAFALFSRFISDAQLVANSGLMSAEIFKTPLISICEVLFHERFADLMQLGHDLVLILMRLSRVSQFVPIWRSLLHNPAALTTKITGFQQLLCIPTSSSLLIHRVSLRISRKMSDMLKNQTRAASLAQSNPAVAKQLQQEFGRQCEAMRTMHLNGPDSGSIRAEIIRHVWAFVEPKEFNQAAIDARATLLGWLLRTAKPGAEMQWCKLVFFWEWYGFESSLPNAHLVAEPVISTIRHLFNTGHSVLGNSLIDFLIKSAVSLYPSLSFFFINSISAAMKSLELNANIQLQTVFSHNKMDQALRDQLRVSFPNLFPKRPTSIADNLAAPSSIIDFDAIRNTSTTSFSSGKTQQGLGEIVTNIIKEEPTTTSTLTMQTLTNGKDQISSTQPLKIEPLSASVVVIEGKFIGVQKPEFPKTGGGGLLGVRRQTAPTESAALSSPVKKKHKGHHHREGKEGGVELGKMSKKREKQGGDGEKEATIFDPTTTTTPLPSSACTVKPSSSGSSLMLIVSDDDEEGGGSVGQSAGGDEGVECFAASGDEQSTSKYRTLSNLLPMIREEFREHLEALNRAVKLGQDDDAIAALQNFVDSISDLDDVEQDEHIAASLLLIFSKYLEKKNYLPSQAPTEDELSELMDQPFYCFFKILCRVDADSRRSLLKITKVMAEECKRIGYLFLFFLATIERESKRLSRGNGAPTIDRAVKTYEDLAKVLDSDWAKQMERDLEQCSFDDYQLYSHILVQVLARLTPYGPPFKVMRFICGSMSPSLLSRLMSEIVRENVVLFANDNVFQLLTDSLKWDSLEQFMLWQLVQTEAVEFDKFLELLQRLNYEQHPEATGAVTVILRNMEPNPDISVMKTLLRSLLLRSPNKDLFTVDAIKLLIDYEENIPPVAGCISKMARKAMSKGDITMAEAGFTPKGRNHQLTAEHIFGHLDRLRKYCMEAESNCAKSLFKNELFLDMIINVKRNIKMVELRSQFDELFALFDIMLDYDHTGHGGKPRRKAKARKSTVDMDGNSREGTPKLRRRKVRESDSEDERQ